MLIDTLLTATPLAKILVVFVFVLILHKIRLPLGLALIVGGLTIDFWAGKSGVSVWQDLTGSLAQPELWLLLINISLILEFGYFMATEPNSRAIMAISRRLAGKHGRAISLILIPATIGLVPMPGGALFSAPLVGEAVKDHAVPEPWKAVVNYWFRHIVEYWWPLYPVVIVTLPIFDIKTWHFFALMIPFTFVSLLVGWFFLLRERMELLVDREYAPAGREGNILPVLLPLIMVVICTLLLPSLFEVIIPSCSSALDKLLGMFVGLVMSLALIGWSSRGSTGRRLFADFASAKTLGVVVTLAGVMLFQSMLEASKLLPEAGAQLGSSAIPVEVIICVLPFLAGLVTGIAIGFSGPAFPLLVGISTSSPDISQAATLVLGFSMGYAGMMISPVHLCYVLTRQYFKVSLFATYRYLVPCTLVIMAWGIIMHIFLRVVGW